MNIASAVIAGVLGFLIWRQGSETSDDLVEFTQDTLGEDMVGLGELDEILHKKDNTLIYTMFGFGCGLAVILTFFLVSTVYQAAVYGKAHHLAPVAIGFTLAASILFGGPLTGGSLNPARSFGPALTGGGLADFWPYLVGPAVGGLVAGALHTWVFADE